jgi:hypothetical protein
MPRSSDSRILGEDLGPWQSSLSSRMVLPLDAALRAVVIPFGYARGDPAIS